MCFGGKPKAQSTPAPAPAPAAPAPLAEATEVGAPRVAEDQANYGSSEPDLRVDRSAGSGVVGGAGLRM